MLVSRNWITALGSYAKLVWGVLRDFGARGVDRRELSLQVLRIGRDSLPVVLLTAVFTGMVLALQTAYGLQRFGAKNYVGNIVGLALVRELGPVLTAVMLCGRVGAGIAAEIGSMVVTEQVDAIRALGANPITKLVTPRVAAAVVAVPALVVFATLIGIFGGELVALYELDQSAYMYQQALYYTIVIRDIIDSMIKSALFGFLVVSIACWHGLSTSGGTAGVGRSTTAAVVSGSIVVFISDFFITKMLLLLTW
jgi:phospholipid/cholesterol/gamma-HCH transport system permease protein